MRIDRIYIDEPRRLHPIARLGTTIHEAIELAVRTGHLNVSELLRWPPCMQRSLFNLYALELPLNPLPEPPPPALPARPRTALGFGLLPPVAP